MLFIIFKKPKIIISRDSEKAFEKIKHPFLLKKKKKEKKRRRNSKQSRIERSFLKK